MSIEAMELALEALEINLVFLRNVKPFKGQEDLASDCVSMTVETITAIKEALAKPKEPEQEPVGFVVDRYNGANTPSLPPTATVAWLNDNPKIGQVLYAAIPPQRKPLTMEQLTNLFHADGADPFEFAQAIEAAHGIKE